ncbi:MAG: arsenite methyltransferase [Dehalococcoidia bacterium]
MEPDEIKKVVRDRYAGIAVRPDGGCGCGPSCCGGSTKPGAISRQIGYSGKDIESVPSGANLGLGCGNPLALASLKEGEVVLDLGAGAGFDCFLAAERVGKTGRVIGVDMTLEMVARARANAQKGGYKNVEFRLGEIENLPVADSSVDAVISNCVINLVPDKRRAFREAFRALKPGGRIMVSDIVLLGELPLNIRQNIDLYIGCVAGAMLRDSYLETIKAAGFEQIEVVSESPFSVKLIASDPTVRVIAENSGVSMETAADVMGSIISVTVHALKPS